MFFQENYFALCSFILYHPHNLRYFGSWGAGCNPWGPERDDVFGKPTHWDGMLEVVGVTGVVHLGQMQSGMRSGIRIAQGGHVSQTRKRLHGAKQKPRLRKTLNIIEKKGKSCVLTG